MNSYMFNYLAGAADAYQKLGLFKYAALGAKTILPAATDMAENVGKAIGKGTGAQSSAYKALPEEMLSETSNVQYGAILGKKHPTMEHPGSEDVRKHLLGQLDEAEQAKVQPFVDPQGSVGTVPPPRARSKPKPKAPQPSGTAEPSLPAPPAAPGAQKSPRPVSGTASTELGPSLRPTQAP